MDARLIAQGLAQRLADDDAGVLHRVVAVHLQVACGLDREVNQAVTSQGGEHVVKEADSGVDLNRAGTVEVEAHLDLRLCGLALDMSGSHASSVQLAAPSPAP